MRWGDIVAALVVFWMFGCSVDYKVEEIDEDTHFIEVSACHERGLAEELDTAAMKACGEGYGIRRIKDGQGCSMTAIAECRKVEER